MMQWAFLVAAGLFVSSACFAQAEEISLDCTMMDPNGRPYTQHYDISPDGVLLNKGGFDRHYIDNNGGRFLFDDKTILFEEVSEGDVKSRFSTTIDRTTGHIEFRLDGGLLGQGTCIKGDAKKVPNKF